MTAERIHIQEHRPILKRTPQSVAQSPTHGAEGPDALQLPAYAHIPRLMGPNRCHRLVRLSEHLNCEFLQRRRCSVLRRFSRGCGAGDPASRRASLDPARASMEHRAAGVARPRPGPSAQRVRAATLHTRRLVRRGIGGEIGRAHV